MLEWYRKTDQTQYSGSHRPDRHSGVKRSQIRAFLTDLVRNRTCDGSEAERILKF